jgi:anthranilate phosphoribosyltransferase
MSAQFAEVIAGLLAKRTMSTHEVRGAFDAILSGAWSPVQVGAFAVALRMGGESYETIVAAAEAMRSAMVAVDHAFPVVVDTCGTGGDGSSTLNLSSGAAVLVAACGLPVAKHGNRSASSRCGSADVFEAMGIPIDVPAARQGQVLAEAGIAFLFALAHHPALKHAAQARRELATRTIFNVLGPLANPARATHQLVGVYDDALRPVVARALGLLGVQRAWVVRSEDGLDEVSPCAPTRVSELRGNGEVAEFLVSPKDFGVDLVPRSAIAGGDAAENARALEAILVGERHPAREAVILNAAAALRVATEEGAPECADRARRVIDEGHAQKTLDRWRLAARRSREN